MVALGVLAGWGRETVWGREPEVWKLWPKGAPERVGAVVGEEKVIAPKNEKDVLRVTDVTVPTLAVYRPEKPNGTAVVVCPGGGYSILAMEHEGTQVCEWLNGIGVTAVLLKYRVPVRLGTPGYEPLQDAQRAMGILRKRSEVLGIRSDRVGILGFSAGGHLAVMTALHANERTYEQDAEWDVEDATPNFLIPVYPAYLVSKEDPFTLLPTVQVTRKAPPVCLVHAHNDHGATSSAASALLYVEYKRLGLPAELHICTQGGHGFGMRRNGVPMDDWPKRVEEWLGAMGYLNPIQP